MSAHRHSPFDYAERCDKCWQCKRVLRVNEPVWRQRVDIGRGYFGGWRTAIVPVCERCFADNSEPLHVISCGPCDNCGRTVHDAAWRFSRRHRYCCEHCQFVDQSARLAAAARRHRAEARGPSRPCAECGEPFEAKRGDARYCSSACRQKAYRKRGALRVPNDAHCLSFESCNAAETRS
jgi:hypothetical protein